MSNAYKGVFSIVLVAAFVSSIIGVSYSYMTSNLSGEDVASTILLDDGKMVITYANNDKTIEIKDAVASKDAIISKKFAVSGTTNSESNMNYDVYLKTDNNTFNDNSLTCSIIGRSLTKNQTMIDANNLVIPKTGELKLGTGTFKARNEAIHEYELNIYYKNKGNNKNKNSYIGQIIVRSDEV